MKTYIVLEGAEYENFNILGVWTTSKQAIDYIKNRIKTYPNYRYFGFHEFVKIEVWTETNCLNLFECKSEKLPEKLQYFEDLI